MKEEVSLILEYPSKIASMLVNDEIDVGLVPVAVIPQFKEHYIVTDYCIGCDGEVGSVCLFSDVEIEKIETVLLDYQSRTSVELLKILLREYWKINPEIKITSAEYQNEIKGTTAGLVIGDRAFKQRKISKHIYDLGLAWKKFTNLPFVFAAWISNKKLDDSFIRSFNNANRFGLENLNKVIDANKYDLFNLKDYYTSYINYSLDQNKIKGLHLFIDKLKNPTI